MKRDRSQEPSGIQRQLLPAFRRREESVRGGRAMLPTGISSVRRMLDTSGLSALVHRLVYRSRRLVRSPAAPRRRRPCRTATWLGRRRGEGRGKEAPRAGPDGSDVSSNVPRRTLFRRRPHPPSGFSARSSRPRLEAAVTREKYLENRIIASHEVRPEVIGANMFTLIGTRTGVLRNAKWYR